MQKVKNQALYIICLFLGCFVFAPPLAAQVADSAWPVFHHDVKRTGSSRYAGPGVKYLRWKFNARAPITASPVVDEDGNVYVGSWNGYFYSWTNAGLLRWRYKTGDIIRSSAAVAADGMVLVGSNDGRLYAFTRGGSLRWTYQTGGAVVSSPVAGDNGTIYFGSSDGNVYALNGDGSLKWRFGDAQNGVDSSPALGDDGRVYIGEWHFYLYGLDRQTGSLEWYWPFKNWFFEEDEADWCFYGGIFASPAVAPDGSLFIGNDQYNRTADCVPAGDYYFFRITPCVTDDGEICFSGANWQLSFADSEDLNIYSTAAVGEDASTLLGAGSSIVHLRPDSNVRWDYPTGGTVQSSPALDSKSRVYVGSDDNYVYALSGTGDLLWHFETYGAVGSSPAIGPGGTIFIGSDDGRIYAIGGALCPLSVFMQGEEQSLGVFRTFRDRVLKNSPIGRLFVDAYYRHAGELIALFNAHPGLQHQAIALTEYLLRNLGALGRGERLQVTPAMLQSLARFLDELQPHAGKKFRRSIDRLRHELKQRTWFAGLGIDLPEQGSIQKNITLTK